MLPRLVGRECKREASAGPSHLIRCRGKPRSSLKGSVAHLPLLDGIRAGFATVRHHRTQLEKREAAAPQHVTSILSCKNSRALLRRGVAFGELCVLPRVFWGPRVYAKRREFELLAFSFSATPATICDTSAGMPARSVLGESFRGAEGTMKVATAARKDGPRPNDDPADTSPADRLSSWRTSSPRQFCVCTLCRFGL